MTGRMIPQDEEGDDERLDRICSLLEEAGVPAAAIAKVREQMLGTGPVRSSAGGAIPGGLTGSHDPANRRQGMDEPPPFPGAPRAGGGPAPYTSSGDADRHAALENMSRIRALTPSDIAYKDGVPFTGTMPNGDEYIHGALLRRPARDTLTQRGHRSTLAMDAASAEDFFTRFPDARRLRKLSRRDHDCTRASTRRRNGRSYTSTRRIELGAGRIHGTPSRPSTLPA